MQDSGKPVQGHAAKLHYELANDFVELTGNAFIEQQDSNIMSESPVRASAGTLVASSMLASKSFRLFLFILNFI